MIPANPDDRAPSSLAERGFALIAVLLVLALLGVIGTEFAVAMRLEATSARSYKERVMATHLAEAGIWEGIREILSDATLIAHPDDGALTFYRTRLQPLPRLPRDEVPLGRGQFTYRITDEQSRLNLNRASAPQLDRLLSTLGWEKEVRDTIVDSIQDWRDANEEHGLNGAESDYYLQLSIPYRARNAPFENIRELLQVRGVTREVYYGRADRPGLRDFVTVVPGPGRVNINTAPEILLRALGFADAEISQIIQNRRLAPYDPGQISQFGTARLVATSLLFRIEADGLVDGQRRARVMAIVKKPGSGQEPQILFWSPDPETPPVSKPDDDTHKPS